LLKLIYHTGSKPFPDDPTFPYLLHVRLSSWLFLPGAGEEIVLRGSSRKVLDQFIAANHLVSQPRLLSLIITGPDDSVLLKIEPINNSNV
jgi:hypothetical protein